MAKENTKPDDLELSEKLFAFLQGIDLCECKIAPDRVPRLTPDQAWTVIWHLGNLYWQPKDFIERCDVCGSLFNTHRGGECLDYGDAPHHFCDSCMDTDEYDNKRRTKQWSNP